MTERINHPGIVFPEQKEERKNSKAVEKVPPWGIRTLAAARVLCMGTQGARDYLIRHKVRCVRIRNVLYWDQKAVASLLAADPVCRELPDGWVFVEEAARMLGVTKCYVHNLSVSGKLTERQFRMVRTAGRGVYNYSCYAADDLERLAQERRGKKRRMAE